jgi:hypothetical protein
LSNFFKKFLSVSLTQNLQSGVVELFSAEPLFQALLLMARSVLPRCYPGVPSAEELEFLFESFLPVIMSVAQNHFVANYSAAITGIMQEVVLLTGDFAKRAVPLVFNHAHVKTLSSCLLALDAACPKIVSSSVLTQLGNKLASDDAGLLMSAAQSKYVPQYFFN